MLAEERQKRIYEILQENNAVSTSALVKNFGVSIETVRRDLLDMEQKQLLRRVHGGAVRMTAEMKSFGYLSQRSQINVEKKIELSRTAAAFVSEGDFIGIDEGSTAIYFAKVLKERFSKMTVVTHALDVFHTLHDYKNFTVILCGGHFMAKENAFYGPLTINMYGQLHLQKAFIFPSAVSYEYGICDYQQEFYFVQKKMTEITDSIYILADSTKYEKKALLKFDDMRPEYIYISDSALDDAAFEKYQEFNLKIFKGD
ncbi:MAG: DeoR/GlpR transcriptional regulator [Clostridia bacterium]|nr:DeoR/GlpR transcriptional regulator [Clostridia bacterium]